MTITPRDFKILNTLKNLAITQTPVKSSRISAAICLKSSIISIGQNSLRSHPFQAKYSKNPEAIYLHAEISAIHNALKILNLEELQKSTLYIQRIKLECNSAQKTWINGLAKPCAGCTRAIVEFGIKRVIYSTDSLDYKILSQ